MPVFKPIFKLFDILKPIWLKIMTGLWPYNVFPKKIVLRGPNNKIITHEIVAWQRIAIWGQTVPQIKNFKKMDPPFFLKKIGVSFLQLFDPKQG